MAESRNIPLRVAIIGTGFGSRVQAPGFMGLAETALVALCGRSDQKTKEVAAQYGIRAVYTDYEQMLVDVEPDIVSITAPPRMHNPMAVAAFQVGAHVLCEKPMAMNLEEAREMLDVAKEYHRVAAIDFEFRYLPARYYQRVLVDQGYIGEPVLLEAHHMSDKRWNPDQPWNWWSDKHEGGGMLGAIGSHFIDSFRWLTGREVRAVNATLDTTPPYTVRPLPDGGARPVTSDDSAFLTLEMDDGLRGHIKVSAIAGAPADRIAIHGTEGALVVEGNQTLWGRRRAESLRVIDVPPEYEPPLWVPDENLLLGPFAKLVGLMVDQIHGRDVVKPPSFADGLAVQAVLDAAHDSSEQQQRVEIAS